ncbi:TIGR03619 family F420-dependent LLM class oxidoreductase [Conexibacter sp. CPCC 206217]|uniref:TIGR03619 family F420-dependent LLM class oxidoreductase n=1 Tax=Conexibacter sp. CPCC 206217 TaxID=3064574 RepID=UPI00272707BC|nr:TIGR03619 family F420-dependent LLM class oxidoreductase [Conexibacter sp. CPCC 206217]MDO8209565.1 TIGR03619 family F420-dependent LLM class oxidoreductase [Conexibacter sp. CPCC 206217]
MRFSLWLYPYGRWGSLEAMGDAAVLAERAGFDSVTVSDHVVCPDGPSAAGVTPDWPDWTVLATYLATRTTRLRIVTSLVVPYRPVLVSAKQIATIDQLSGGRFTLAAAVGWLAPEFAMLGVDHAERGAITDEYLRAMKALWTQPRPAFAGEHVQFSDLTFEPRCAQAPHVPIWIAGGTGPAPLRRVVELGDGWMPMGAALDDELRTTVVTLKERVADAGRDPDALTIRYTIGIGRAEQELDRLSASIAARDDERSATVPGEPEAVAEAVARYAAAGFNELAINFAGTSAAEVNEQLSWFGEAVAPLVNGAGNVR